MADKTTEEPQQCATAMLTELLATEPKACTAGYDAYAVRRACRVTLQQIGNLLYGPSFGLAAYRREMAHQRSMTVREWLAGYDLNTPWLKASVIANGAKLGYSEEEITAAFALFPGVECRFIAPECMGSGHTQWCESVEAWRDWVDKTFDHLVRTEFKLLDGSTRVESSVEYSVYRVLYSSYTVAFRIDGTPRFAWNVDKKRLDAIAKLPDYGAKATELKRILKELLPGFWDSGQCAAEITLHAGNALWEIADKHGVFNTTIPATETGRQIPELRWIGGSMGPHREYYKLEVSNRFLLRYDGCKDEHEEHADWLVCKQELQHAKRTGGMRAFCEKVVNENAFALSAKLYEKIAWEGISPVDEQRLREKVKALMGGVRAQLADGLVPCLDLLLRGFTLEDQTRSYGAEDRPPEEGLQVAGGGFAGAMTPPVDTHFPR